MLCDSLVLSLSLLRSYDKTNYRTGDTDVLCGGASAYDCKHLFYHLEGNLGTAKYVNSILFNDNKS